MRPISDTLLDEMTQKLVRKFQPEPVILFGSHAWGTPDRSSDIDLMVIVEQSDLSDCERAILALACLSDVDVPKDVIGIAVVTKSKHGPCLSRVVSRDGILARLWLNMALYKREERAAI